ncbi:MAG: ABC transporter permease [Parvibaculaceae bacterium]|nr:ABC transporter permease [Parvibaculaceae bacterium]
MKRFPQTVWYAFGLVSVLFMISPLAIVMFFSFTGNRHATLPAGGFTFDWYRELAANPDFWPALTNSLIVVGFVGLISMVIGTLAALALVKLRPGLAGGISNLLAFPLMLPPLVLALALVTSFSWIGAPLGLWTVILSHLVFTQPFVILIVTAQMQGFDESLIECSRDLGASPWQSFSTIVLPIIRATLIGATLIAMSISLDDFVITFFTIGGGLTLSTLIWGMLRTSLDPSINALGTLILFFTLGASTLALRITNYRG